MASQNYGMAILDALRRKRQEEQADKANRPDLGKAIGGMFGGALASGKFYSPETGFDFSSLISPEAGFGAASGYLQPTSDDPLINLLSGGLAGAGQAQQYGEGIRKSQEIEEAKKAEQAKRIIDMIKEDYTPVEPEFNQGQMPEGTVKLPQEVGGSAFWKKEPGDPKGQMTEYQRENLKLRRAALDKEKAQTQPSEGARIVFNRLSGGLPEEETIQWIKDHGHLSLYDKNWLLQKLVYQEKF